MQKIGRNDSCYCGSGIKVKKCCNTAQKTQQREAEAKAKALKDYEEKNSKRSPKDKLKTQLMIASILGLSL